MKIGFIMDPIAGIRPEKDSTFAMLLAAQARGWTAYCMGLSDLALRGGQLFCRLRRVLVRDQAEHWFDLEPPQWQAADFLDCLLMRKDPPVDMRYMHALRMLGQAGDVPVHNRPSGILESNEKLFITRFPDCIPPTLVSMCPEMILEFVHEQKQIVLKPLDGMGGEGIFRSHADDPNLSVIIETMTAHGTQAIMAQAFLPEVDQGDKRILMIHGEPVPYCLARIPAAGEFRANLARGGTGKGQELSARDREICAQVGPALRERGLLFCGLDVIGGHLTEINVTSPTCIRELDKCFDLDIAGQLLDTLQTL